LKVRWQEKALERLHMYQKLKQKTNVSVNSSRKNMISEVELTLNKNEEYESNRREKASKEAYLGTFLQQKFL
jgi:hypothetical protein